MRAIWSGSLSFGLINIPVRVYSAAEERALKFHMLQKGTHCPIQYLRVCRGSEEPVPYQDIVKGYEYEKGAYVIMDEKDFEKAAPRKTKTIDIKSFAKESEVPPDYVVRPYYIEPDKKAAKAYVLLREALKESGKIGVATWVLREKEHIAMLAPRGKTLMLIQLRYADELRKPTGLYMPGKAEYSKREVDMALLLVEQLSEKFDPEAYKDTYTEELQKVIAQKAKGRPVRAKDEPVPVTDMRDLMEILRESLKEERGEGKSSRRRAAART